MKKYNNYSKLMKSKLWSVILLLLIFPRPFATAQSMPELDWVKSIGSGIQTSGSANDPFGSVYTLGSFSERNDFNPGINPGDTLFLQSHSSGYATYICKLDSNGNFLWAKGFNAFGTGNYSHYIMPYFPPTIDASGNSFILLLTADSAFYIDNGMGGLDTFVNSTRHLVNTFRRFVLVKFNPSGHLDWAKWITGNIAGYNIHGSNKRVATDESGNIYLTGIQSDTLIFDPGGWNYSLPLIQYPVYENAAFICKLDSSGNFLWAKQFAKGNNQIGGATMVQIAPGTDRTFYVSGGFQGDSLDFDPGAGVVNFPAGQGELFLSKFNSDGNLIWAVSLGRVPFGQTGAVASPPSAITTDHFGNAYLAGRFNGSIDFEPGSDSFILQAPMVLNSFYITKLNSSGGFVWAKALKAVVDTSLNGGIQQSLINSVAVDNQGNLYYTGLFQKKMDFDPGLDSFNLSATNENNAIFVGTLNDTGGFRWAFKMENNNSPHTSEEGVSVIVNDSGALCVTGYFTGTNDFDPGSAVYNLTAGTPGAVFVQKLKDNTTMGISGMEMPPQKLLLYPNPAGSEIWLKNDNHDVMKSVVINNILGQVVFQQKINRQKKLYRIDIRNYASGIYFVTVGLANGKESQGKFEIRR